MVLLVHVRTESKQVRDIRQGRDRSLLESDLRHPRGPGHLGESI
jgi:hypothetical protein